MKPLKARFIVVKPEGIINAHTKDKEWEFSASSPVGDMLSFAQSSCDVRGCAILELTDPADNNRKFYLAMTHIQKPKELPSLYDRMPPACAPHAPQSSGIIWHKND